jgi:hypothetical protein
MVYAFLSGYVSSAKGLVTYCTSSIVIPCTVYSLAHFALSVRVAGDP